MSSLASGQCYCRICGAANTGERPTCWVCQRPCLCDDEEERDERDRVLHGRYRLLQVLGFGGFAVVYRAEDRHHAGKLVAIKQIPITGLSPRETIEATDTFNREVQVLTGLSHPHLPHLLDHFQDRDHWYLVLDFLEGETLDHYLARRSASAERTCGLLLPLTEVLEIALQLCSTLAYLHQQKPAIIFRDLKPSNIIRNSQGHLCLIDFGIARQFKPGQASDTMPLGSPGYAAPEQYGKAQTSPQTDMYSLGALLHQLLSGRDPCEQPLSFAPLRLPGIQGGPALAALVEQMLALDASRRPQSMGEVAEALERIQRFQAGGDRPLAWTLPSATSAILQEPPIPWYPPAPSQRQHQQHVLEKRATLVSRRALLTGGLAGASAVLFGGLLWDVGSQGIARFSLPYLTWSPRLTYVAITDADGNANNHSVEIRDGRTQQFISAFEPPWGGSIYWSPDETQVLLAGKRADIWRVTDGEQVGQIEEVEIPNTVAWSPDGQRVATAHLGKLQTWSAIDGKRLFTHTFAANYSPIALSWSPDNHSLAFAGRFWPIEQNIWVTGGIWEADGSESVRDLSRALQEGIDYVDRGALSWSPDGTHIAIGNGSGTLGILKVSDASMTSLIKREHDFVAWPVAWSPAGKFLAVCRTGAVEVWRSTDYQKVQTLESGLHGLQALAWTTDGSQIMAVDGSQKIRSWRALTPSF
jgi:eukaryotic-like serine/threonine-protein kinase